MSMSKYRTGNVQYFLEYQALDYVAGSNARECIEKASCIGAICFFYEMEVCCLSSVCARHLVQRVYFEIETVL